MHRSGAALRALDPAPSSSAPPDGLPAVQRALAAAMQATDSRHAAVRAAVAVALRRCVCGSLVGGGDKPAGAMSRARSLDREVSETGPDALLVPAPRGRGHDSDSDGLDEEWHLPAASGGAARSQLRRGTSAEGRSGVWAAAGRRWRRRVSPPRLWAAAGSNQRGRAGRPDSPLQGRRSSLSCLD